MKLHYAFLTIFSLFLLLATTKSQDFPVGSCGDQAGGALCAEGFCCSKWGWCGNTSAYCDAENCQSQCPPPPSPPPPPQGELPCGVQHGGATCPPTMCCTIMGYCANSRGPLCSRDLCQSNCGPAQCGVDAGGAPCDNRIHCCTIGGSCALYTSPICMPPFCQSQCYFGQKESARISMLKASG
ncbi:hypothetical protein Leryth_020709 [Lithospermum erythrorhizon]|nr:hypothetical protein Leryth_020709 [Lithospermum erythrorhizon]